MKTQFTHLLTRARKALGLPIVRDCDMCHGPAWEVRTVEGRTACIVCVEAERADEEHAHLGTSLTLSSMATALSARMRRCHNTTALLDEMTHERDELRVELNGVIAERDEARRDRDHIHRVMFEETR